MLQNDFQFFENLMIFLLKQWSIISIFHIFLYICEKFQTQKKKKNLLWHV